MIHPAATSAAVATLFGPQHGGNHQVAARADLPVGLYRYAAPQFVFYQRLVRFGKAKLPGQARVADAAQGRGSRATVVARNQDMVGVGFGYACRNRTHACLRH
jgi:hypothetical protein